MTRLASFFAAAAILAGLPPTTFSHAPHPSTVPAAGATDPAAPDAMEIVFSESLEPKYSAITVTDAAGAEVQSGEAHLVNGDGKRLGVALRPLQPGIYTVTWHATSTDTHKTEGSYRFTVGK